MIWMELTWTDAVFSRIAMVLFLCRNKKFSEWHENPWRIILENIKNICGKIHVRGPTPCPCGWGARPLPRGPPDAPPTSTPTPYIHFRGEKIREKDLSCFTIRSRRQALKPLGRADLVSVRGSGEGDSSLSSSSTIFHHQFHDACDAPDSIVH